MSTPELEQRLRAAAAHYSFPSTPELARAARARLPERRPRSRADRGGWRRRAGGRCRGDSRRVAGCAERAARPARPRPGRAHRAARVAARRPVHGDALLRRRGRARRGRAPPGRPLPLPRAFGEPDAVYPLVDLPGDMVTAVYGGDDEARELVFSQWKTSGRDQFYKVLTFNSAAEPAEVAGAPALWIHGADHGVWYAAPDGTEEIYDMEGYLAGNTLVWRVGDLLYRLEADVTRERALELAASLR